MHLLQGMTHQMRQMTGQSLKGQGLSVTCPEHKGQLPLQICWLRHDDHQVPVLPADIKH